jgi:hypothetical protein
MANKSTISDFKIAVQRHRGFAKANRFAVEITNMPGLSTEGARDLSFMCESVSIPGKQITTLDYDNGTRRPFKIPTGVLDDDVAITFNLTNNYFVKQAFDTWLNTIIDQQYLLNYIDKYVREVTISQLDENDNEIYSVVLKNAYPFQVAAIELANASTDTISTVTVTFACDEVMTPASQQAQSALSFIGDVNVPTLPIV